jgi:hypothetical protein
VSNLAEAAVPPSVDALVTDARATLLRRCAADPLRTQAAVVWAASRLVENPACGIGPDGELSARSVKVTLAHLAAQRAALDIAYEQLERQAAALETGGDELHQAYYELLRGLPDNPHWCCDAGAPRPGAARAQLSGRAKHRRIDGHHQRSRVLPVDDVERVTAAHAADVTDEPFRRLYAYLRAHLPVGDHDKLDRLVLHAVFKVPYDAIARESGKSHAALRQERARLANRIRPLLETYEG